ncbi:MAG: AI-2E family transporter [Anaerolineales bacterium]
MSELHPSRSPRWGSMTKLVVALTAVALLGILLIRYHAILGPLILAVVIAYLLQPFATYIERKASLSWGMTVNLIYLVFVILVIGLAFWGGVGLIQQIESLIVTIQQAINNLPGFITDLSGKVYHFGPFLLDFSKFDWGSYGQQILSYVQPTLGRLTNLVATLATSAASTLGWTAFVLFVSYFILFESGDLRGRIIPIEIPGYAEDIRRLNNQLGRIWNAFLRGQMIIFLASTVAYTLVFSLLGMRFAIGLGLLSGFANFLPYIGPAISWIVIGLVTYFQGANPLGLVPLGYAAVSVLVAIVIQQIFSLVTTLIMAESLKVNPAIVLIATIIAADLFGLLGLFIAAPLVATLRLFGQYVFRKIFDMDPWPAEAEIPTKKRPRLRFNTIKKRWRAFRQKRA